MKKISIIIVTYKSLNLIKDCIDSIYEFNDLKQDEIEIIVVDNSDIEDGKLMKRFLQSNYSNDIIFIKNENLGYGSGNNIGVRNAKSDIVLIMNPDVRLTEPLFLKTLQHFENKNVASLSYQQINGGTDFSFFKFPESHIPIIYSIQNKKDNNNKKFNQNKHSLSGAFVFFRKTDFVNAGMYDEDMFMYLEEPDIAKRILNLKKDIVFDSSIKYLHLMEHKDDFNEKLLDIGTNSIAIYFTKHNLNLKSYIKSRIIELYLHRIIFKIISNKKRVKKAEAYINSLRKAYEYQKKYINSK